MYLPFCCWWGRWFRREISSSSRKPTRSFRYCCLTMPSIFLASGFWPGFCVMDITGRNWAGCLIWGQVSFRWHMVFLSSLFRFRCRIAYSVWKIWQLMQPGLWLGFLGFIFLDESINCNKKGDRLLFTGVIKKAACPHFQAKCFMTNLLAKSTVFSSVSKFKTAPI